MGYYWWCWDMWVSIVMGGPQRVYFIRENPIAMEDLGVPPFMETPKWAMSETCDYKPMSHKIARPYAMLTRPSLCRIRSLAPDLTQCLRDHNFYLRSVHGQMTYAKLTLIGVWLKTHRKCLRQKFFRPWADANAVGNLKTVGNAKITWTPWLRTWGHRLLNHGDGPLRQYLLTRCLRGAYAELTRSIREFAIPNL